MKTKTKLGLSMAILIISVIFIAAKKENTISIKNKLFNHKYAKVGDSLYAEVTETTNQDYRLFLDYLKNSGNKSLFNKCNYDSTNWITEFPTDFMKPFSENYHWHSAYNNYPIVNITHDAAIDYCKWLTAEYDKMSKKEFKKVLFRLPTEKEWIKACAPFVNNNFPWYGKQAYNTDYEFLANVKFTDYRSESANYIEDGGFACLIVGNYKANSNNLYDVIGNVAEMTSVSGIQKGGSWDNYIEECGVDKRQKYKDSDPRVGFRVFMEVIEE